MTRQAYKLLRKRKNGSIGSLFVDRTTKLPLGKWLSAVDHKPTNLAHRPGWHCLPRPLAPHLSEKGRVWCVVEVDDFKKIDRPQSQGGTWLLANRMRIVKELSEAEIKAILLGKEIDYCNVSVNVDDESCRQIREDSRLCRKIITC
jgi:hypothetical protein